MLELVDQRVLGAFRFVSAASGLPVTNAMSLSAEKLTLKRNASGRWVVFAAEGLEEYIASFDTPPIAPDVQSLKYSVDVRDPTGLYLSRRFQLRLPRDADASHGDQANSLFVAQDVRMFPSPSAAAQPNWSTVHVTVRRASDQKRIAGALVVIAPSLPKLDIGRGLTDAGGEAIVAISGIPKLMASAGPGNVVTDHIDASLTVTVDPAAATFVSDAQVLDARIAALRGTGGYPDPDDLEARSAQLATQQQSIQLSSGSSQSLSITVTV